ncbi:hypothetical protein Tco_0711218 [Tanacetum coccineum]
MRKVGKGFPGREAPLFQTKVVQHQEEIDGAVIEEMDNSLKRVATSATRLDAERDRGNIDKTQSKETLNEPSSLGTSSGNTLRSGEDRLKLEELMEFCTKLQQRVFDLENLKTTQAQEITSLKLRVKKLEKKRGSRTHKLKRLYKVGRSARMVSFDDASLGVLDDDEVFAGQDMDEKEINVAENEVSTANPITTISEVVTTASPTKTIIVDDLTLAQTLIEIKSAKSKVKGVVIGEQSESTTRTRPQQLPSKDKGKGIMKDPEKPTKKKDQIRHDEEVAQRLQAQMQVKLKEEDRLNKSFNDIQKLFDKAMKRVNTFVDMDTELVEGSEVRAKAEIAQESSSKRAVQKERFKESDSKRAGTELEQEIIKKQKVDEDKETTELQRLIEVVPDKEEVPIDAIPLETKPPIIVDYKIHNQGKKTYYQIIRTDGSSKMYLVFSHMLKSFDMEDLETLWKLVKAKHGLTRLEEGCERVL